MNQNSQSSRRAFLKGGAIVAAPLAAIGAPAAALAAEDRRSRDKLATLEEERAIRALHDTWTRHISRGERAEAAKLYASDQCACALAGIAAIAPDQAGPADTVTLAPDGNRARATYAALVEVETLIAPENTLAQMLHVQGEGSVRRTEARSLAADYIRTRDGNWAIARLEFSRG